MKTLGWSDRARAGHMTVIHGFGIDRRTGRGIPGQNRSERIAEAFKSFEGLGNAEIWLVRGRKRRRIAERGW